MGLELEGVIAERGQEKEGPKEKESWGHAGGAGVQPSSRAPDGKNLFSCRCLLAADKVDWTEGLGCRCLPRLRGISILPNRSQSELSLYLSASMASPFSPSH